MTNVQAQDTYPTQAVPLRAFVAAILESGGAAPEDAAFVAEVLVEADLRGVESHGVTRLAGYMEMISRDLLNPTPNITVLHDSMATASIDGDMGFGMLAALRGMNMAIDKAREYGLGAVTSRNMAHTGMVGYYTMHAASQGMIGMAMNNGPTIVPPFGGLTPTYATNPFSIAFPAGDEQPVVLDMATSMVAAGKLRLAAKKGAPIPIDWGMDREGNPSSDPAEVLQHGFLQWAGGYKGFGVATMVEILGGVLSGGLFGLGVPALVNFGQDPLIANGFYLAIDIQLFMPLADFHSKVDTLVQNVRSSKPAIGVDRVYIAGEPEFERKKLRLIEGIPLSGAVFEELESLSQQYEVAFSLR